MVGLSKIVRGRSRSGGTGVRPVEVNASSRGVVLAVVDVEVAQRDEVVVPAELGLGPVGQPLRDRGQLRDPVGGARAVIYVQVTSTTVCPAEAKLTA